MALINCPECGKEISDKAESCPNCGYPINPVKKSSQENSVNQNSGLKNKKNRKKIGCIVVGILIVICIGGGVYYKKIVIPRQIEEQNKNVYSEAISLLEKGKYDDGIQKLNTIKDYEDVSTILDEAKYESYAYSAVNAVKKILKNPDSISVYEVHFYDDSSKTDSEVVDNTEDENENKDNNSSDSSNNSDSSFPCVVLYIGAQNGFGGNTTSYAYCTYDLDEKAYTLAGFTNELDADDLDEDDDNYLYYYFSAMMIENYLESGNEVGEIDQDRFNTVLKNSAYSSIRIID